MVVYDAESVTKFGSTTHGFVEETILGQGDDRLWLTAVTHPQTRLAPEIADLVSPFFYADHAHTFYVEPTLTETTIEAYDDWIPSTPSYATLDPAKVDLASQRPYYQRVGPRDPIGPLARYIVDLPRDWVTDPRTVVKLDGSVIGEAGRVDVIQRRLS
jgi:hypothetical protein